MPNKSPNRSADASVNSAWHVTKLICYAVVVVSVLACVAIAAVRSDGLTQVRITALSAKAEPRDHSIPLFKQKDALPDYEITVNLDGRPSVRLGAKPNTSATDGLTWALNDPVSVSEVTSIRLQDQDKIVSDAIAEVQVTGETVSTENYEFEFTTERSISVGVRSFFRTPIGMAIAGAFFIAVLLMLVSAYQG